MYTVAKSYNLYEEDGSDMYSVGDLVSVKYIKNDIDETIHRACGYITQISSDSIYIDDVIYIDVDMIESICK